MGESMKYGGWRDRVLKEVAKEEARSGRKPNKISLDAGAGRNYISQLKRRKGANVDSLLKLCSHLELSITYVFTGQPITAKGEQMLIAFGALPDGIQDHYIGLLQHAVSLEAGHTEETSPASREEDD